MFDLRVVRIQQEWYPSTVGAYAATFADRRTKQHSSPREKGFTRTTAKVSRSRSAGRRRRLEIV